MIAGLNYNDIRDIANGNVEQNHFTKNLDKNELLVELADLYIKKNNEDFTDENLEHNITLYHASDNKFDNFDINYANTKAHKEQMKGIWLSNSRKYIKQFGKIIYTCKVDNSNILNIDSGKYDKIINQFEKKYNIPFDLEGNNAGKAQKYLIDNGYTGIYFEKEKGVYVYVIFDANIIKIIGNIGKIRQFTHKTHRIKVYNGRIN